MTDNVEQWKGTPGKWESYGPSRVNFVFDHEASVGPDAADGRSGPIAVVGGDSDEMAVANARLIAAAPEMFTILTDLVNAPTRDKFDAALTAARAIIAKQAARPAPAGTESEEAR